MVAACLINYTGCSGRNLSYFGRTLLRYNQGKGKGRGRRRTDHEGPKRE